MTGLCCVAQLGIGWKSTQLQNDSWQGPLGGSNPEGSTARTLHGYRLLGTCSRSSML